MRKTEFAFWTFLLMTGLAGATTLLNVTRTYSATSENSELYRQLDLFGDVLERVRSDYVEKPDDTMLIESAINGMLSALDPHSSYLSPKNYRDMQVQTRGEFGGLGIEVTMENGVVKVVSPIDDTPAAKAGLQANDLITHLDGEQIVGLTLEQAVEKMRGPVNTPISLTIVRKGIDDPFDVKVTRDIIRINAVKAHDEKDVAYIKVTTFNEQTHTNLVKAIENAKKSIGKDLKGYIIDLRNNPGGLLDQAIAVSDDFLERGAVVLTKGRNNEETQRAQAHPGDLTDGKKVVVLINGGSASASEIVAGALQDHKRATVIGTRSFGKGSVQTIIPLGANGAIRLTTARYYTPSNRSIQAKGIDPDIVIEQELPDELKKKAAAAEASRGEASLRGHLRNPENGNGEDGKEVKETSGSSAYVPKEPEKDVQLQYALSFLRGTATDGKTAGATIPAPHDHAACRRRQGKGEELRLRLRNWAVWLHLSYRWAPLRRPSSFPIPTTRHPGISMSRSHPTPRYRPCVGITVINTSGLVWVGRRADGAGEEEGRGQWWQMPQGGIDTGEDPADAALRELIEETGMRTVKIIGETSGWLRYDLPPHLIGKAWGGRYVGQDQKWFAVRFLGDESEIDITPATGHKAEFTEWRWVPLPRSPTSSCHSSARCTCRWSLRSPHMPGQD